MAHSSFYFDYRGCKIRHRATISDLSLSVSVRKSEKDPPREKEEGSEKPTLAFLGSSVDFVDLIRFGAEKNIFLVAVVCFGRSICCTERESSSKPRVRNVVVEDKM